MNCPRCKDRKTKVLQTREVANITRRRRECLNCGHRFTTVEQIREHNLVVVKKDGSRERFEPQKLSAGIWKSFAKRKVFPQQIEDLVSKVQDVIVHKPRHEITSDELGELVINGLREIDQVAYIRFASVYRDFNSAKSFIDELQKLEQK